MNRQLCEEVQNFRYSGALKNSKNLVSDEIRSRIAASNRCFYSLRQIFRYRDTNKAVKIKIYKAMVKPVVVHGSETWAMTEKGMKTRSTWERKISRIRRSLV